MKLILDNYKKIDGKKRTSVRGIIIDGDEVYTIFRRRVNYKGDSKEYFVIPGGGLEKGETLDEALLRELKEELSIDVKIIGYLGFDESDNSIAYFFKCKILNGIPFLGGEELERCSKDNYYEIRKVNICDIDNIDILGRDMIIKAYNNEFK